MHTHTPYAPAIRRFINADGSVYDGEIVVFQQTTPGVFHGYVVQWDKLSNDIKNALIRSGWVNRKGKIK